MSNVSAPPAGNSPGFIDRAETFAESDVTASIAGAAEQQGESVSMQTGDGTQWVSGGDTAGYVGSASEVGTIYQAKADLSAVKVNLLGPQGSGTTRWAPYDTSTNSIGTTLDSAAATGGDTVTLSGSVADGDHFIVLHDDGTTDETATTGTSASGTATVTHVSGWEGAGESSELYAVDALTPVYGGTSGSVTVEWPHPPDVYGWDTATFQATEDGETVGVYIEESTDGGGSWTEVAGPLSRGDDIPADPSNEVRFRVVLSRTNTANNPTLDALYRRYTV